MLFLMSVVFNSCVYEMKKTGDAAQMFYTVCFQSFCFFRPTVQTQRYLILNHIKLKKPLG